MSTYPQWKQTSWYSSLGYHAMYVLSNFDRSHPGVLDRHYVTDLSEAKDEIRLIDYQAYIDLCDAECADADNIHLPKGVLRDLGPDNLDPPPPDGPVPRPRQDVDPEWAKTSEVYRNWWKQ